MRGGFHDMETSRQVIHRLRSACGQRFGALGTRFKALKLRAIVGFARGQPGPDRQSEERLVAHVHQHRGQLRGAMGAGIDGADESWAEPLDDEPARRQFHQQLASDVDWIRRYLGPWLGKGIRGVPHGDGVDPKRPVPTVVPRSMTRSRSGS